MIYSYYADEEGRVLSICPDDLTGSSGWHRGDIPISPADDLTDDHGAALYKVADGAIVPRSQAEREADWPVEPEPEPEHPMTVKEMREKISELTALVMNEAAPFVAEKTFQAGDIITNGARVYIAGQVIVQGETVTPGVNCTETTIADVLNAIQAQQ